MLGYVFIAIGMTGALITCSIAGSKLTDTYEVLREYGYSIWAALLSGLVYFMLVMVCGLSLTYIGLLAFVHILLAFPR